MPRAKKHPETVTYLRTEQEIVIKPWGCARLLSARASGVCLEERHLLHSNSADYSQWAAGLPAIDSSCCGYQSPSAVVWLVCFFASVFSGFGPLLLHRRFTCLQAVIQTACRTLCLQRHLRLCPERERKDAERRG